MNFSHSLLICQKSINVFIEHLIFYTQISNDSMPRPSTTLRSSCEPYLRDSRCFSQPAPPNHSAWRKIVTKLTSVVRKRELELTKDKLQAHNLKYHEASPYLQGLTDSSLAIQTASRPVATRSRPRSECLTTNSGATSTMSVSALAGRMQEWGSCFSRKRHRQMEKREVSNSSFGRTAGKPLRERVSQLSESQKKSQSLAGDDVKMNTKSGYSNDALEAKGQSLRDATRLIKPEIEQDVEKTPDGDVLETLETMNIVDEIEKKSLRESVSESIIEPTVLPNGDHIRGVAKVKDKNSANQKESGIDFTWGDKFRPKALEDFICNREKALQLKGWAKQEKACGHFIFEGPPGVGKKTMIRAMLNETFGTDKINAREECKHFYLNKGEIVGNFQVHVKQSPQHVEVNVSNLRGHEIHVMVELFKETKKNNGSTTSPCRREDCRAIILYEADKLPKDALLYVKWLLEKYKGWYNVIFCSSDASKLQPIRALCTVVQLLPPSIAEIIDVLKYIAKQEGIELPHKLAGKMAEKSQNNLREAVRSFEATWKNRYPFVQDQHILTGWEYDISNIAKNIVEEQSPKQLYIIHGKLQNLVAHDVPSDFIFRNLVEELKKHLSEQQGHRLDELYAEYKRDDGNVIEKDISSVGEESNRNNFDGTKKNTRNYSRIEEFIAKFMSCYKHATTTPGKRSMPLLQDAT